MISAEDIVSSIELFSHPKEPQPTEIFLSRAPRCWTAGLQPWLEAFCNDGRFEKPDTQASALTRRDVIRRQVRMLWSSLNGTVVVRMSRKGSASYSTQATTPTHRSIQPRATVFWTIPIAQRSAARDSPFAPRSRPATSIHTASRRHRIFRRDHERPRKAVDPD